MRRIEISAPGVNLIEIVRHVVRDRVPVELAEGEVPVARLVPIDKTHSMGELDRAMRKNLDPGDDAESFAQDVLSVRQTLGELDDPWGS